MLNNGRRELEKHSWEMFFFLGNSLWKYLVCLLASIWQFNLLKSQTRTLTHFTSPPCKHGDQLSVFWYTYYQWWYLQLKFCKSQYKQLHFEIMVFLQVIQYACYLKQTKYDRTKKKTNPEVKLQTYFNNSISNQCWTFVKSNS